MVPLVLNMLIPIIAVTADVMEGTKLRTEIGMSNYLSKPIKKKHYTK
jgi:CheY-like chemotaxis protein